MTSLGYREAIAGLSWPPSANQVLSIVALLLAYVTCLGIYRLYLSPLASIPGPKIAGTHYRRAHWAPSNLLFLISWPLQPSLPSTQDIMTCTDVANMSGSSRRCTRNMVSLLPYIALARPKRLSQKVLSSELGQMSSISMIRNSLIKSTLAHRGVAARNTKLPLTSLEPLEPY
jgi:hypothetical protein